MGSSQSAESIQEQFSSSISENLTKVFNKKVNTSSSSVTGVQEIYINFGKRATLTNCDLDVSQKQTIDAATYSFFKDMSDSSLKTDIKDALNNALKSDQSQESASLSLVPYNKQDSANIQRVTQIVKKVVENVVDNQTFNNCTARLDANQLMTINFNAPIDCKGKSLKFTQEMLLKSLANCVSDTVTKQTFENKQIADLTATAVASQKITVNQWGAIIGLAIIGIIVLVAGYIYMKSKDPSQFAGMMGGGGGGRGPPIFYPSPQQEQWNRNYRPPEYEYPEGYPTGFRFKFY
jgi:hypothetical protein